MSQSSDSPLWQRNLLLGITLAIAIVSLCRVKLNEERVALVRWGQALSEDYGFLQTVETNCSLIVGEEQSDYEAALLRSINLIRNAGPIKRCDLKVSFQKATRFRLRSFWTFSVELRNASGFLIQKSFPISFPLPLAVTPLLLWFLLTVFYIKHSLVGAMTLWLFFCVGLNPSQLVAQGIQSLDRLLIIEKNFLALCLLLFWSNMLKHSRTTRNARWPQLAGLSLGIWNPASLAGLIPIQYSLKLKASAIIDPMIVMALSAYFLAPQTDSLAPILGNLTLPRYFTFAVLLLLGGGLILRLTSQKSEKTVDRMMVIRSLVGCAIMESLAWKFSGIRELGLFLRSAIAINLSLIVTPQLFDWPKIFKDCMGVKWLFLGLFVNSFMMTTGFTDVVLEYWNPIYHPNAIVLFTFLSGLFLGGLTGSFSFSYFQILPLITKFQHDPLTQAALVDGITAGMLFSPLHPISLITFAYFHNQTQSIFQERLKVLLPPLVLAILIFSLSSIRSVMILQPITFIFLCLLAAALKLRSRRWALA